MRLWCRSNPGGRGWRSMLVALLVSVAAAGAGVPGIGNPSASAQSAAPPAAAAAGDMNSAGWLENIMMKLEGEAIADIAMLPDAPGALEREWRLLDRNGSAMGSLVNVGWVVLIATVAVGLEKLVAGGLSRRARRNLRTRPEGVGLGALLLLILCDAAGVAVLAGAFVYSRHWLMNMGASVSLVLLSASVLVRWRIGVLIVGALLRPKEPVARLIELPDGEARRLSRFLSAVIFAIMLLFGILRFSLADEDSGAAHIIGLGVALLIAGLYVLIVFQARPLAEALIRGRRSDGVIAALRNGVARAWVPIGLGGVAGLMVFFVFGLSLGLLAYNRAISTTIEVVLLLLVLERLTDHGWHDADARSATVARGGDDRLMARAFHRMLRAIVVAIGAIAVSWTWLEAIEPSAAKAAASGQSFTAAVLTLFAAYLAWEVSRLAFDRHLRTGSSGPALPGDDDEEMTPGSRLQTMLPMLRVAFGTLIAVVAVLVVLSRLGVDTAPLIAGAGVFGLAVSFGSQSLVRDVISGLFYMWDDAFRVGEYIDTGRLKGTVEALGIRSLKLRHHNGPLHTIPYGQLGAVTNQSRDFATIKFNLRLEPGTNVELVRKTAKQIGIAMQENPEIAAEVMLPLKLQGIAEVVDNAVIMRFKFTARPVKPSWIQREYLKRIYQVFAEKGIIFASGALTLQTAPMRSGPPSAADAEAAAEAASASSPLDLAVRAAPSRVA